ncbi:MAG: SDR family NAD(P)-dependent oxidoreductase, partial [Oscillospiraceae bacterium]
MKRDFIGKRILVTGGASGVGLEIAKAFSNNGGLVVVADLRIDEDKASALIKEHGFERCVCLDVSNANQVNSVIGELEYLDVLVNNAGIYPTCDFFQMTPELWKQMIDVD